MNTSSLYSEIIQLGTIKSIIGFGLYKNNSKFSDKSIPFELKYNFT